MSTNTVKVPVLGPMVPTGLMVSPGDSLHITCAGHIDEGYLVRLGPPKIQVDADGKNLSGQLDDDRRPDGGYPYQDASRYALIGRIDDGRGGSTFFAAGTNVYIDVKVAGALFVGANDDQPGDNTTVGGIQSPWSVTIDHKVPKPPPPPGTPGITVDAIRVMQVAQVDRSSPGASTVLVGGKTTAVRAFLSVPKPLPVGTPVNGFLEVSRVGGPPAPPINALNPPGTPDAVQVPVKGVVVDADKASASLNFEVPGSLLIADIETSSYSFKVTAFVGSSPNPERGFSDSDHESASFVFGRPVVLNVLKIRAPLTGWFDPPVDPTPVAILTRAGVEARMPVPDGLLAMVPATPDTITVEISVGGDGGDYDDVVLRVNVMRWAGFVKPRSGGIVMGLVVPSSTKGSKTVGIQMDETVIVGLYPFADTTAVHEVNHVVGLHHVDGCMMSPANVDPSLPQTSAAPGWSTLTHTVVPTGTPAIQSYCNNTWPTAEEYFRSYRGLVRP